MNYRRVNAIFRKEILDTMRDKRTLIMMVGVPVVLYPLLLVMGLQAALLQHTYLEERESVVVLTGRDTEILRTWLEPISKIRIIDSEHPERDLMEGRIDALVGTQQHILEVLESGGSVVINIRFDNTEFSSMDAAGRVESALQKIFQELRLERLEIQNLTESYIRPLDIQRTNVAPPEKTTGSVLGLILPMIMVLVVSLGAFYPAVDIIAGEKERGTFESLLSTPTSKLEIVTGKFLTVFSLALITGMLNLASMAATTTFMAAQFSTVIGDSQGFDFRLPLEAFYIIFLVLIPLALLVSAVMMSIAVIARSFKEAQNYVTPFFLIILLPAILGGLPGTSLTPVSSFIPIYNIVVLFKELMMGKAALGDVGAVFLSTSLFAVLALQVAVWLFHQEDVVLSEERGVPLTLNRRKLLPREHLTPTMAIGLYCTLFLGLIYGGIFLQDLDLTLGIFVTQWGILALPVLLFVWFVKADFRAVLSLRRPRAGIGLWLGAILAGLGTIVLIIQFGAWQQRLIPPPVELQELMTELLSLGESPGGLLVLLLLIAVSPAICEELLFRGALVSGLRQWLRPWAVVVVVGLLFGLFHISIFRILPTALLGMLLTYFVLRSGSLYPAILIHLLNNGLAVMLATGHMPGFVFQWLGIDPHLEELEVIPDLPLPALLMALLAFVLGLLLFERAIRKRSGKKADATTN